MKNYARIENGAVVELFATDGDITEMFHPDLIWVECSDDVQVGHTFNDGEFSAPVVVTLTPVIPSVVSMRQARLALLEIGALDYVQQAIDALPDNLRKAAQIEWDYATAVDRNSELTQMLAAALGLDESHLDELFLTAAGL